MPCFSVTAKHQQQQQHFWQFNLQSLHPGSPSSEQTAIHGGDTVQGHVFSTVPNDPARHELLLCIPDMESHASWMQCIDLYEIVSFSTLQFSTLLSLVCPGVGVSEKLVRTTFLSVRHEHDYSLSSSAGIGLAANDDSIVTEMTESCIIIIFSSHSLAAIALAKLLLRRAGCATPDGSANFH